ncbi:MAG: HAMP domain-containing histidine kinase [Clostridiaceae bacterium]|nr:HAMP domain-containing histidine kinase [Clostridiaceae bacterium]
MSLSTNREAKNFLTVLLLVLVLYFMLVQMVTYRRAAEFKNEMIAHDYELAGYLVDRHPEILSDIQSVFTSDKSAEYLETGRGLLEKSGYKESLQIRLIPRVKEFYKADSLSGFELFLLMSTAVLAAAFLFLKGHYKKIDLLNSDVNRIREGEISIRLDDNEEGSLSRLAASINDITLSLKAHIEREMQQRNFLKDIMANVSHQLKTPLSALSMYTEIMRNEITDTEVLLSFLQKSENELARMKYLIMNLLKLARLDAGIIELNKKEHALKDIINEAAESFRTRVLTEQKSLVIMAENNVVCNCDRLWLLEALSNLIKNAVEHTGKGDIITVLVEETPLIVKVSVSDTGEGIHPDDIRHIFKRFYRSKFSQEVQGTGIGLTLAKTIVEMHGGFITVESTLKKGSVFTVHFPNLTKL